jgi:outer membrane protein assembly factor BamB
MERSDGPENVLNPATGAPIWQTGLPGVVLGTPALNGSGVIAVATYDGSGVTNAGYLIDASTGRILTTLDTGNQKVFGQPSSQTRT